MTTKVKGKQRAAAGTGTILAQGQRPDGRYFARWQVRAKAPSGELKRPAGTAIAPLGASQADAIKLAQEDAQRAKVEVEGGIANDVSKITVNQLVEMYLDVKASDVSARTLKINQDLHRLYIKPRIGGLRVRDLQPMHIVELQMALKAEGVERSRKMVHNLLVQALDHAVVLGILPFHPGRSIKVPKVAPPKRSRLADEGSVLAWTQNEVTALYREAIRDGTVMAWAIALALFTGLRRSEVFGLRWDNIDLKLTKDTPSGTLSVRQIVGKNEAGRPYLTKPKTPTSRRTIPLVPQARLVIDLVRRWQEQQASKGTGWQNSENLVFTTRKGEMQHPDNIARKLKELTAAAGVPNHNPHATRHTYATLAHAAGASLAEIAAVLGHKNTIVTETVYRHTFERVAPLLDFAPLPSGECEATDRKNRHDGMLFKSKDQAWLDRLTTSFSVVTINETKKPQVIQSLNTNQQEKMASRTAKTNARALSSAG